MSNSHCYHCSLPIPQGVELETVILGETRAMCCVGCQAVSQAIVDNQLDDYYRFRTEPAQQAEIQGQNILQQLSLYDDPNIQEEFVALSGDEHIIQLSVDGISCSACGWLIEKKLAQLNGVKRIAVNVSAQRATVTWDNDNIALSDILLTLERVGYHALPFQPDQHEAGFKAKNKQYLKQLGLAGLMTMQVMMLAIGLYFSLFGFIEDHISSSLHL